ncbi:hypothetical protein VCUG_00789 [Vavraia culicis subsp. floridensis]|uniref:EF-hand domain-containing protein n=1 Tax=Vavraia culicis (isolate floridensis) TaxID=948595 RepID=L2GWG6_VAVCU|nr:uncharacterized protein VCUG_00789 [Vavraia culicis subsp. floridensis]ELA47707.1 hypothetical protein VCUG_00789 [Vavraia culicis subsp. floridensis]
MRQRINRRRQPSNVFSMLTQTQISSLKEVFNMIDNPPDDKIDTSDLNNFLPTIVNHEQLHEFQNLEKDIGFYALLAAMSDKFIGMSSKECIRKLLLSFSDDNVTVRKSELMKYLRCEQLTGTDLEYVFSVFGDEEVLEIEKVVNLIRHGEIEPNAEKKRIAV